MIRNGLFLCSIGFLIVLYSLNPSSLNYDLLSLTTGIFHWTWWLPVLKEKSC